MCPLTMEAVLNQIGRGLFVGADWPDVERFSPREKLDAVAAAVDLSVDFRCSPWRDFRPMFRFRSQLVHAKFERHIMVDIHPRHLDDDGYLEEVPHSLKGEWETMCTLKTADRWWESVRAMSAALADGADTFDPVRVAGAIDYWNTAPRRG